MVACSTDFDPEIDEFEIAGFTKKLSKRIKSPRVKEAKISFECTLNQIIEIGEGKAGSGFIVIGTIVLFHIEDSVYENGRINLAQLSPLGRLAGNSYSRSNDTFEIVRKIKPKDD